MHFRQKAVGGKLLQALNKYTYISNRFQLVAVFRNRINLSKDPLTFFQITSKKYSDDLRGIPQSTVFCFSILSLKPS